MTLISADRLHDMLEDAAATDLVLIDCRSFGQYSKGHIPGAVNLDLFAFHWLDTSKAGIDMFNVQAQQLFFFAGLCRGPDTKAVFYDDVSGMLAARGAWMAQYLSHPAAYMLDGGLQLWKSRGFPTETQTRGFLSPGRPAAKERVDSSIIAGYEHILENPGKLHVIDARSRAEYDGTVTRAARSGHIPGAINIDWNQNLNPDGTFKHDGALRELYRLPKDAPIITYCQGAYRAANSFLALKKIGYTNVRVYLGSWGEWGSRPGLPVEK